MVDELLNKVLEKEVLEQGSLFQLECLLWLSGKVA